MEALRAGAGGFLLKDAAPAQIAEAVRTVASGESIGTRSHAPARRTLRPHASGTSAQGACLPSSRGASLVVVLVARGLSNREIAARLFLSEATVKTHVTRVLAKLSVRDRVQAVVLAYETGLVEPGSEEAPPS